MKLRLEAEARTHGCVFTVAQIFNLPYRRFVIGSAPIFPRTLNRAGVPQATKTFTHASTGPMERAFSALASAVRVPSPLGRAGMMGAFGAPRSASAATTAHATKPESRRGFSLIELMVVIVLIGIMAAMIVPEMKGTYEDALLRSTSRRLVDAFHLAYSRAVSLNQLHRVRFDRITGRYFIEKASQAAGNGFVPARDIAEGEGALDHRIFVEFRKQDEAPPSETDQGMAGASAAELEVRNKDESFTFYGDGTADAGEVVLRDRDGFRLALRINPVTARVQIVELERQ